MYWSIDQSRCHDNLPWHSGEQRPLYRMHPLSNYPLARGTLPFRAPNDVCVPGCIGDRAAGVGVRDCACAAPIRPHWAAAIVRAAVPTKRRRSQLRSSDMCLSPIGYPSGLPRIVWETGTVCAMFHVSPMTAVICTPLASRPRKAPAAHQHALDRPWRSGKTPPFTSAKLARHDCCSRCRSRVAPRPHCRSQKGYPSVIVCAPVPPHGRAGYRRGAQRGTTPGVRPCG